MSEEERVEEEITSPAEDTIVESEAPREAHEIVQADKDADRKSIKELLRGEFDKAKREPSPARQEAAAKRARERETGKFLPKDDVTPSAESATISTAVEPEKVTTPVPVAETPIPQPAAATPGASPAPVTPPASWSKEAKDVWASLPPAVQQAASKREQEVNNGFAQYQTRYQDIDRAFTPNRDAQLQQLGRTRGQAVDQLFAWHEALGDPQRKADAFRALAQAHGINLSTLVQGQPQGQNFDPNDPRVFVQQSVQPLYEELNALRAGYQRLTAEQQQVVNQRTHAELADFAKDKPHFEAVRSKMAELFEGARVTGRQITLQEAYDAAVWGSGDLRQTLLAEQEAKRVADADAQAKAQQAKAAEAELERKRKDREAADKARRANVSPRASTPVGSTAPRKDSSQSVRDDIQKAIKDVSRASL